MNLNDIPARIDIPAIDTTAAESIAGGGDSCSLESLLRVTQDLTQAYENLVDFASHVIGRVAGEP